MKCCILLAVGPLYRAGMLVEASAETVATTACHAQPGQASRDCWEQSLRRQGNLQLNVARRQSSEEVEEGTRAGVELFADVFYGRPIVRVPTQSMLSLENIQDAQLREEVQALLRDLGEEEGALEAAMFKSSAGMGESLSHPHMDGLGDASHIVELCFALIAEARNSSSNFRPWLDAVRGAKVLAQELTDRQQEALVGTTVGGVRQEMVDMARFIEDSSHRLSVFRTAPISFAEAAWALAVIAKEGRPVLQRHDPREAPRVELLPVVELLHARLHPDQVSGSLPLRDAEARTTGEENGIVLQIAPRDMRRGLGPSRRHGTPRATRPAGLAHNLAMSGEEVFLWPGRFSSSVALLRHGGAGNASDLASFAQNPVGVGGVLQLPENWSRNKITAIYKEYEKYNCSTPAAFELRFSQKGWPMRDFVRCTRIAELWAKGAYKPEYVERMALLNKWPPPRKYSHADWLQWTQADQEVNRLILDYCRAMKRQLKETISAATADDFRSSSDPVDQLLWNLRSEESRIFKKCVDLANTVKVGAK